MIHPLEGVFFPGLSLLSHWQDCLSPSLSQQINHPDFMKQLMQILPFSQQVQRIRMVTLAKKLSTLLKNFGR
jgi:hypothetical protein